MHAPPLSGPRICLSPHSGGGGNHPLPIERTHQEMRSRSPLPIERVEGLLLGTAVGDAVCLTYEGITPQRQARLRRGALRHTLLFGRGMVSDDTEHVGMTAQALIATARVEDFRKELAQRLKVWGALIPAGIGSATLRAVMRLWFGVPPERSGVHSAGNGPCMRSTIIGLLHGDDPHTLMAYVEASSRITHTDPRATAGALALAYAAHHSAFATEVEGSRYLDEVLRLLTLTGDRDLHHPLRRAVISVAAGESTVGFARSLGLSGGVSGFVLHTVPVAVHAWLSTPENFVEAMESVLACGGDTDTVGALVGGIIGARITPRGIPEPLLHNLWEPAFGPPLLRDIARALVRTHETGRTESPPEVSTLRRIGRNGVFAATVLAHGFRRLAPPY